MSVDYCMYWLTYLVACVSRVAERAIFNWTSFLALIVSLYPRDVCGVVT